MRIASVTSPDMGMVDVPEGTILRFLGAKPDEVENRRGWYWYEFEILLEA